MGGWSHTRRERHADIHATIRAQAYALFRMVAGLLFIWRGTQKLLGFPATSPPVPGFAAFIAGPIELIGGLRVTIGPFAGWAAFLCSGLMAAAYWMVHGFQALFPIANGGELAALYGFIFLYIAARGRRSGVWTPRAERASGFRELHHR